MVSEHANPLASLGGVDAGGQNVHVAALAANLARFGHDVTVFTRRDDPTSPRRIQADDGYTVELVPAGPAAEVPKDELLPHMPAFGACLARRWASEPYDVAHTHFWMSGLAGLAAAGPLGIPQVHTFHALGGVKRRHQGAADTSPANRIPIEERLCERVDHIIATCTDEVSELQAMGCPEPRTTVIPCGVDIDLFRPAGEPPARGARKRLLMVGRLVPRKGGEDLVKALARLPDTELVIAGGPRADALAADPEAERLHAVARSVGVADRVRFLGRVPHHEMPALYWSADVVVSAPWYEPFGIVPVESMACGRPVVGTAVGGLLDTVLPGVTGELVPPRRPDQLAEALRGLLDDERKRDAYGRAGVKRAHSTYRWDRIAKDTERVYAAVAAQKTAASTGVAS